MYTETPPTVETATVQIAAEVKPSLEGKILTMEGPLGRVSKDFSKIPIKLSFKEGAIELSPLSKGKRGRAVLYTSKKLIENMIIGVTKGFTYKLKIVYSHFPLSVKVKGNLVIIENFYGERYPRYAKIVGDTTVQVVGEDVVVKGISKEDVGQTVANIEQAARIKRKDLRVFLNGIYVYEKYKG